MTDLRKGRRVFRAWGVLFAAALGIACSSGKPVELPKPEGDVPSAGQFPHAMFSRLLEQVVAPDGLVDYAAVEREKETLDRFLGEVARISPLGQPHLFPTFEDQLAYWINAHNAAALKGVLILGRPKDLSKLGGQLDRMPFLFGGRTLTLLGVAGVIRREFPDPRPFVVLVRGRRGGPPLAREAFEAKDVEAKLEAAAEAFVRSPRFVQWTPGSDTVKVTRLILDYRSVFQGIEPATLSGDRHLIESLNHFLPGRQRILASKVAPLAVDERLNDVSNR